MGLLILFIFIGVLFYFVRKKKKSYILTFWNDKEPSMTIDEKYNHDKVERQKEIDRILDKIYNKGYDSITQKEKDYLSKHSKKK